MIQTCKSQNNCMNDSMDMRRFFLCLASKVWMMATAIVVGAILGFVIYTIVVNITDGQQKYQINSDYYVSFNEADHPDGMDYYNAYTWNEFVTDDKIVDYALSVSDGITREDIKSSVQSVMLSDYRVLTVRVTGTDVNKVNAIAESYKQAMPYFATQVDELSSIELWSCEDMIELNEHVYGKNAAVLGAVITLVICGFAWAVYYCMDTTIYTEADFKKKFTDVRFLGYDTPLYGADLELNRKTVSEGKDIMDVEDVSSSIEEIKKHDGCVLLVPMGKKQATQIEYDLELLKKQSVEVAGVVLTNCNEKFLKHYYGRK